MALLKGLARALEHDPHCARNELKWARRGTLPTCINQRQWLAAHILIKVPPAPFVRNRIPTDKPPQLRVIVPIAVIEEPGFLIESSSGVGIGIGETEL